MRSAMVFAAACGIDAAAELTGALLGVPRSNREMHAFDNIHRARANADNNRSGAGQAEIVDLQSCIFERHHGSGIGELRMPCHPLGLQFRFDIFRRIEAFYFPGDSAFQILRRQKE